MLFKRRKCILKFKMFAHAVLLKHRTRVRCFKRTASGGGIGMGNTCKPLAVSFQCMTKSITNKKKMVGKKKI